MSAHPHRLPSKHLAHFPWATLGRREAEEELFRKCGEQRARVAILKEMPLFSFVVAVDGSVSRDELAVTLESIELQSYSRWEVVLVGGRGSAGLRSVIPPEAHNGGRFLWLDAEGWAKSIEGTVDAKNRGAQAARGEWLCFVEAGDVIGPSALFTVALELESDPADVVFSHEAQVNRSRTRVTRFFSKPRFGWFNLAHFDVLGKSWWVRRRRFEEVEGMDAAAGIHHEHDFLLRLTERTQAFHLVPAYLLYRREKALPSVDELLRSRVEAHAARLGHRISVRLDNGALRLQPEIAEPEARLVSVIVCFRNRADWTILCLNSLAAHLGRVPVEIWAVNNGSRPEEAARVRRACRRLPCPAEVIDYEGPFNFARMHNTVVRERCRGQYLLLLNNDVFWQKGSLDELVAWAQFDWVGTVGNLLRFPHGPVQHGGFRAFFGGSARLARLGHVQGDEPFSRQSHEVFGNTFASCLVKRSTFDAVGGLREIEVPNGFGDVVFNFECLRRRFHNVYLGGVEGVQLESGSRGTDYEYWEECFVERHYPDLLQRMLREDLGYNRVPGEDYSVPRFLKDAALAKLRDRAPWLKPIKLEVKKVISRWKQQPTFKLTETKNDLHRPIEV